jgi:hypothetical protein
MNHLYTNLENAVLSVEDRTAYEKAAQRFPHDPTKCVANQPFYGIIKSESDFNKVIKVAVQNFSDAEKPLGLKTLQKWICPQGGTFDFDTLTKNINEYYKTRHVLPELMDLTIAVSTQWFLNNAPQPKLHDPLTYGKGNATKIIISFAVPIVQTVE